MWRFGLFLLLSLSLAQNPWQQWWWQVAYLYEDIPYLWGGNGEGGFDCSGLVVYIFRSLGITLPRTSRQQFAVGVPVETVALGDLLFFSESGQFVDHVAIYLGDGYMLHASGRHRRVVIEPWTALADMYVGARRVVDFASSGLPQVP